MTKFFATAAFVAALAFPMAAQAVTTIDAYETYSGNGVITSTSSDVLFEFKASEDLKVGTISLTGNGPTPNVSAISILITPPGGTPTTWDLVVSQAGQDIGFSFASGLVLAAHDTFSILFSGTVTQDVDVDYNFSTSPVPLPAAGGMLLTAVVAGGIAARRKKKSA